MKFSFSAVLSCSCWSEEAESLPGSIFEGQNLKKIETKASRKTKFLSGRTALPVRYQLGKAEGRSSSLYQVPLNFSQSSNFETNKSETLSGYRAWDWTVPTQHQAAEQTKDSWWARLLHRKHVATLKYKVCGHRSQLKRAKKAAQPSRAVT